MAMFTPEMSLSATTTTTTTTKTREPHASQVAQAGKTQKTMRYPFVFYDLK
jgi:hypothetical protein